MKTRKILLVQFWAMFILMTVSVIINIAMLVICVDNHEITYTHVIMSTLFFFVGMLCQRIAYDTCQQIHAEEEEWIQHQLDMADDYASREL